MNNIIKYEMNKQYDHNILHGFVYNLHVVSNSNRQRFVLFYIK